MLYVGYNDGVLVSENYGLTWDVFAAGDWPQEDQFAFDPNDPDTIYMVVGSDIYVTHDKAQTPWTMLAEQLPEGYSITTLHPSTDGTLYVGTFNPFTNPEDPGIFKWDGGPGPFVYVEFPTNAYEDPLNATSLFTHVIADDPAHDMVYLGGELTPVPGSEYNPFPDPEDDPSPVGYDAPNLRSTSGGSTWENMNNGSISSHVTSLIVDPGDSRIYAAQEGSTLWASDDLGVCWQPLATAGYPALVLDSNDNTRFFGGSWGPTDDVPEWKRGGVWVSTDRGAHFAAAGLQGDHPVVGDPSQYTTSVAVNSTSARIYATGYFGTGLWSAPIPAGL
ncbi:hypothetical protein OV079_45035 [Nannocystis pusilla]|uniref:Glycosyl hydrolase n=1 Tax=Nannocystis pusilla TaxID=889268 RepID=A0A9X3J2D7_9BACT|nr:hypothetical protein [Nannocystis pusilla]MCY1012581.1 hypothetical protein [Nannocystis pusilla]